MPLLSVTVQGATDNPTANHVTANYQSAGTEAIAFQLASIISQLSRSGSVVANVGQGTTTPSYLVAGTPTTPLPALPTIPGGQDIGIFVVSSVNGGGAYAPPNDYTAIINSAQAPVTINAAAAAGLPYTVLSGSFGTVFDGGAGAIGGEILLGGGANTLTGSGGLNGDWRIWTGSAIPLGVPTGSDLVNLGTGNTTVDMGSADTVNAGGGNVIAWVNNAAGGPGSTFFIGSGNATVIGGSSGNLTIVPGANGTGGGVYILGSGGDSYVRAGGGNSTLIGGGDRDQLIASTVAGSVNIMKAGNGADVIASAAKEGGSSEIWGGSGTETLQGGIGNDTILAGGGTDSIIMGTGNQQLWFSKSFTNGANDIVDNFALEKQTLVLYGYGAAPTVTSAAGQTLQLQLADNTRITFTNLKSGDFGTLMNTQIVG